MEAMKKCCACGATKNLDEFYWRPNNRPYRQTERTYSHRCKECDKAATRASNARYATESGTRVLPVQKQCSRCRLVKPAADFPLSRSKKAGLHSACLDCCRDRKYGLERGEFERLFAEQDGKCAICRLVFASRNDVCVDHCHVTDRVRGLLCSNCNAALGMFNDDPALLARAIDYLKAVADRG